MSHPFNGINFIKTQKKYDPKANGSAPLFRRRFSITEDIVTAELFVCGLGLGYYHLNGAPVTDDLFTAPCSDYRKTLWYNRYDVKDRLTVGDNILAVQCGNGWYNEPFKTSWDHNIAPWRDNPKFILALVVNGKTVVCSDAKWKCTDDSAVIYNQLRSGEYFDARLYDPAWTTLDFDDSTWANALSDTTPPVGVFRETPCEPIRADRIYPAITMDDRGDGRYIFDLGQNMSGFVRLHVDGRQAEGDELDIRYAEKLDVGGEMDYYSMGNHYHESDFAHDRFICDGKTFDWSPRFAYHGFRFIEVTGLKDPDLSTVSGVFVHQDVKLRSSFECSDEFLNGIFRAGQMATWSNLYWMPTDCPTREKLGWCNDAQASCEQMLTDFETERLFEKWLRDLFDAQLPDGAMPGICPSSGWGYGWGNGPVSDGVLFEVPYRLYLHTGETKHLVRALPYFDRYFAYLKSREDEDGNLSFGLDDWAPPDWNDMVKNTFVNSVYRVKLYRIAALAASFTGVDPAPYQAGLENAIAAHKAKYLRPDGTCTVEKQTAAAMMLYHDIYDDPKPLVSQLARLIEEKDFHHDCGMVGLRHLYMALNKFGMHDYAYKIVTAEGFPSYRNWYNDGCTTLYEMWNMQASHNHHMYSDFMSWMMKTIIGIEISEPAYKAIRLDPHFFEGLSFARGHIDTVHGRISVDWKREADSVHLTVILPDTVDGLYNGTVLHGGTHTFVIGA